jgi:hypothetical protein
LVVIGRFPLRQPIGAGSAVASDTGSRKDGEDGEGGEVE